MSFRYLTVERVKNCVVFGASAKAMADFPVDSIVLWLITTGVSFKSDGVKAKPSPSAESILAEHEASALLSLDELSSAGKMLVESVLLSCEAPVSNDPDQSLELIHLALTHAKSISQVQIPKLKVGYSLKKHRDSAKMKLMTIKGDPVGLMGAEAAGLAIATILNAASRELDVSIAVINKSEIFGPGYSKPRPAPDYADKNIWRIRFILVDYLTKQVNLLKAKDSIGAIKVLCDHFDQFQTSCQEGSQAS